MEKRKIIKRTAVICLAIVIVAAFTLCVFTKGFTDWRFGKELSSVNDLNSNVVVTPQESGGAMTLSVMGTESTNSALFSDSIAITATLAPITSENKTIVWSAAWQDADSEWARGKEVSDYLSLGAESSQSGESIALNCTDDFGERIVVTAKAEADEMIFASCRIDFRKKIESLQYTFKKDVETIATPSADADGVYRLDYTGEEVVYTVECTPVYSDYTLEDTSYECAITGNFTDTFGYTSEAGFKEISLQAGLYGAGSIEPPLTEEAQQFVDGVGGMCNDTVATPAPSDVLLSWQLISAVMAMQYDEFPEEMKMHSRVANAYEAFMRIKETLDKNILTQGTLDDAKEIFDSYVAPTVSGSFIGGIEIESEDALLTAAKACNDAGKGIAEFTVTYIGTYGAYSETLSLGYTESSIAAARAMYLSLSSVIF